MNAVFFLKHIKNKFIKTKEKNIYEIVIEKVLTKDMLFNVLSNKYIICEAGDVCGGILYNLYQKDYNGGIKQIYWNEDLTPFQQKDNLIKILNLL